MVERAAAGREWAISQALPLWSDAGFDPDLGLFHERLDLNGAPVADAPRRLTTQARQIYTLAHAAHLGWWTGGRDKAIAAAHAMIDRYWAVDGRPGWVFSIQADGSPADPRRELYAHAFALFGLAWAFRLEPDPRFLALRDATLALLDGDFAGPGGGYLSFLADPGQLRHQNPHMHLLEAMLAWHETTGDAAFLARAGAIRDLFTTRFFDSGRGILPETFGPGWAHPSDVQGCIVEPGHHFEWVWLLHRLADAAGGEAAAECAALYAHACRYGQDGDGLIVSALTGDGALRSGARRTWPHTEAIKAHAVMHAAGDSAAQGRCEAIWDAMFSRFLAGAAPGGWRDHFTAEGALVWHYMPATTLYHVFCAIAEANRIWRS